MLKLGLPMLIEPGTAAEANFWMAELSRRHLQRDLATKCGQLGQGVEQGGKKEKRNILAGYLEKRVAAADVAAKLAEVAARPRMSDRLSNID